MEKILSKVARDVAGAIYNPVTLIKGYVDLLEMRIRSGNLNLETLDQIFKNIQENCVRATDIAESLHTLTVETNDSVPVWCDLSLLVDQSVSVFKERFKKAGIRIQVKHENKAQQVLCFQQQTHLVLTCILASVIERVEKKSIRGIGLSTSIRKETDEQEWVVIRIHDSGSAFVPPSTFDFFRQNLLNIGATIEQVASSFGACLELKFHLRMKKKES